ncbi:uncharacterized protein DFL_002057 [Arthrobotrys flagrans]|uniref:Uncharacterized protein n=1 Tax=Arthrobotrys flagrans TaxID=97331 RepID=A0A437AAD8_ARTFL|nr:hypothetical protein DFL_002057 [Arthrobotrys flagrans]
MGDINPVSDTVHPPPAGLQDMNPETQKQWSLWMEMVYDTLIHPRKYEKLSKDSKWTHPQLKAIDPTGDLCRQDNEKDPDHPELDNPDYWGFRPELTHFINRNDEKNKDKEITDLPDPIQWSGFPKIMDWAVFVGAHKVTKKGHLVAQSVPSKWQNPDSGDRNNIYWQADRFRVFQDEYLEWAVTRENGRLKKVTFTCEGPEYWQLLAKYQPETVMELYKSFVPKSEQSNITKEALWTLVDDAGEPLYNPENEWNSPKPENGCIAHLIHPNSTLSAEVTIVADGTIRRNKLFEEDKETLCTHGGFGEPYRNSDPTIGWETYKTCGIDKEAETAVTLGEPIGLYIQNWDSGKFIPPDNAPEDFDMKECWHPKRVPQGDDSPEANDGPWVRVEFYVPEGRNFDLEDLRIVGADSELHPLRYGSQIAQHINIGVSVGGTDAEDDVPPAQDLEHDWERLTEVIKDEKKAKEYDVDNSEFWHYMQYKAIARSKKDKGDQGVWSRWIAAYGELNFARMEEGGDTGKPLRDPNEVRISGKD